jgi:hypothetical protein
MSEVERTKELPATFVKLYYIRLDKSGCVTQNYPDEGFSLDRRCMNQRKSNHVLLFFIVAGKYQAALLVRSVPFFDGL